MKTRHAHCKAIPKSGMVGFAVLLLTAIFICTGCENPSGPGGNPALKGTVSIDGTAKAAQILTANTGALAGSGAVSYQWKRGNAANAVAEVINGATGETYTLALADQGKYIAVTVSRAGYTGGVTSATVGPVTASGPSPGSALISISVKTGPDKTVYAIGETLDLAWLVITAAYSDNSTADISDTGKFTASGFNSSAAAESQTVTISYTEDGVTKTAAVTVTIEVIGIYSPATWTQVELAPAFDTSTVIRGVTYGGGKFVAVADWFGPSLSMRRPTPNWA